MLIGSGFLGAAAAPHTAVPASASPVKPVPSPDLSRPTGQTPSMRESIHQLMTQMKDPEVSGLVALMKAEERAEQASLRDAMAAYGDNS